MTELDLIKHAQSYINRLANGINPLNNQRVSEDELINNIHISRCLFYVSNILQKVIYNDGHIGSKNNTQKIKKLSFNITEEQLAQVRLFNKSISLSEFIENINQVVDTNVYNKLTYKIVSEWLVKQNFLEVKTINNHNKKVLTHKSSSIGISLEHRQVKDKTYPVIVYNIDAQKFILSSLMDIIHELSINSSV